MRRSLVLAAVLVTAGLAGCVTTDAEGSSSLYVKDAPTDEFEEIHVVFSDAYVHEGGDENETDDNESEEDEGPSTEGGPSSQESQMQADFAQHGDRGGQAGENQFREEAGWISLVDSEDPIDVNLLNATGTQAAFLGETNLSAGTYTQIAVVVDDAYGIDDNGTEVDITVPSGVGRIVQSFEVEEGQETQIVVDLDLDQAMTEANGEWKLTPKFGQTQTRTVDDAGSGSDEHEPGEVADIGE